MSFKTYFNMCVFQMTKRVMHIINTPGDKIKEKQLLSESLTPTVSRSGGSGRVNMKL